jgi:hypothetical protein
LAFGFALLVAIKRVTAPVALPMIFVLLGMLALQFEMAGISSNRIRKIYDEGRIESNEPVEVEGVIVGSPEPGYDGTFLVIKTDRLRFKSEEQKVTGLVRLFLPLSDSNTASEFERLNLRYGSRIDCVLQTPARRGVPESGRNIADRDAR